MQYIISDLVAVPIAHLRFSLLYFSRAYKPIFIESTFHAFGTILEAYLGQVGWLIIGWFIFKTITFHRNLANSRCLSTV